MATLKARNLLGPYLLLAACNPETDLQKERASTPGTDAGAGQVSVGPAVPQGGQLVDPPSGSSDLATNLANVVMRFPEAVVAGQGPGALLRAAGSSAAVPLQLGNEIPCATKCYAFNLASELAASTSYTVEVVAGGLQFLDGKPVAAGDAGSFITGTAPDLFAPRVKSFAVQVAEGCAVVHLEADEQVRPQVVISSNGTDTTLASPAVAVTVDFSQRLPALGADPRASAIARVVDRAGNEGLSSPVTVSLPAPVPRIVISEVLANPVGSETTQEFVELFNAGEVPIAIGGWTIEDKTGKDVLPETTLLVGAYALIVSDAYNPADGKDPAPAEGTVLVHVAGRIGSDGLSNSGEPVRLLNSDGQIVSQYGGWVDVSATAWSGKSTKRVSMDACDAADAWSKAPSLPTPGW